MGVDSSKIFLSRMSKIFLDSWYPSIVETFLHTYLSPLVWLHWKMVEWITRLTLGLYPGDPMYPKHSILKDFRTAIALCPLELRQYLQEKKIIPINSEIDYFEENGVYLKDGTFLEADLVILCTGFKNSGLSYLPQEYQHLEEEDGLYLYKHILHPEIPDLAFIGFNHSFLHIPTCEISVHWLCNVLNGNLLLPSKEDQMKYIQDLKDWKRNNLHFEPVRAMNVGSRFLHYIDELLNDLGLNTGRKSNPLEELFGEYVPSDWKELKHEIDKNSKFQSM